jgi:hypothetical protein
MPPTLLVLTLSLGLQYGAYPNTIINQPHASPRIVMLDALPPHPEEARSAVSKGGIHLLCFPPFETHRFAVLLRVRPS